MATIIGHHWYNYAKKPYDRYPGIGGNPLYTTPSGRKLYRHSEDEGSCLCYYRYGVYVVLFIPDCKYRATGTWTNLYSSLKTYGSDEVLYYIEGDATSSAGNLAITDKALESHTRLNGYKYWPTGFWQTRTWSTFESATASQGSIQLTATWKSTTIGTIAEMTGPDLYEGILLRIEGKYIDQLDKYRTDSTYSAYCFSPTYSGNSSWFGASTNTTPFMWTVTRSPSNMYGVTGSTIATFANGTVGLQAPVRELRYGEWWYY